MRLQRWMPLLEKESNWLVLTKFAELIASETEM